MKLKKICEDTRDMGMWELSHNFAFIKDGEVWYRDFEREISALDLMREIIDKHSDADRISGLSNQELNDIIMDDLQYGTGDLDGVFAMLYMALCGMAEVRDWLKQYVDEKWEENREVKELLNNIDKAIEQELHMANEQNPLFRSTHEGLGVILEEVEEALTEQEKLCRHFNSFKASVFDDSFLEKDADFSTLGLMATDAKHLAAEVVQVAAMCQKFVESFCKVQVMIGRCIKGVKPCAWRVPKGMEIKVGDMCKVIMQHGSSYARAERIEEWTQSEAEDVKAFVEEVIE